MMSIKNISYFRIAIVIINKVNLVKSKMLRMVVIVDIGFGALSSIEHESPSGQLHLI